LGGTLESPSRLSDEARANLKNSFQQMHGGVDNTGKTAVLEEGLSYKPFTFTNEAGLYTETRSFQIAEVARLFNISPTKLHDLGRATWANLGTLNTDFYVTTLRPWLEKIEAEVERKLFGLPSDFYVEFLADSYLRGDVTTRYANYAIALTNGWLTKDEVREFENLPPLPEEAEDNLSADETDGDIEPVQTQVEEDGTQKPNGDVANEG
jgi:HK97 family phage portal protein